MYSLIISDCRQAALYPRIKQVFLILRVSRISEELRDHFSTYGDIESINVKTDPNTGRSRGFAFIVFAKAEALDKVIYNVRIFNSTKKK